MKLEKLTDIIQSSHINFLFGAGLSRPYLTTLGDIETWLTDCATIEDEEVRQIIEDNIKIAYVDGVMKPCLDAISKKDKPEALQMVEAAYQDFLRNWNHIISRRGSTLLSKQVNIFTTNIDPLLEGIAEDLGIEFNNGFKGMMRPVFREEVFSTTVSKVSPFYQRTSELPTFNYLKMHGSINWKRKEKNDAEIFYDGSLETLAKVVECMEKYPFRYPVIEELKNKLDEENEGKDDSEKKKLQIENLSKAVADAIRRKQSAPKVGGAVEEEIPAQSLNIDSASSELMESFQKAYGKLVMINPRKAKFRETVLDFHFYELMRLYANALEKPTTCLFVMGFSFADEHIAQITRRAASSNPTLLVIIFAYDDTAKEAIGKCIGESNNNNIIILSPSEFKRAQAEEGEEAFEGLEKFDLASINKYVFGQIKNRIK